MSATDELRRLLDERGVEHFGDGYSHITSFFMGGVWASVTETSTGKLMLRMTFETPEQAVAATLGPCSDSCNCTNGERTDLAAENAALREQMERLVTLLRNDCDIDASWDGLRRFWSIGLTEDGCLMRDRACKAEAENAKLRAMQDTWQENDARLRELVRDMFAFLDGADCARFPAGDVVITQAQVGNFYDRMAQLGMEVDG